MNKVFEQLFKNLDAFLMACLFFTLLIGLFVLLSASGQNMPRVYGQLTNIAVAMVLMWVVTQISPTTLERFAMPLYIFGVLLLLAVELFGSISTVHSAG